jgi:hypothetical protein
MPSRSGFDGRSLTLYRPDASGFRRAGHSFCFHALRLAGRSRRIFSSRIGTDESRSAGAVLYRRTICAALVAGSLPMLDEYIRYLNRKYATRSRWTN